MPVFQTINGEVCSLAVQGFRSEKELHNFFHDNLEVLLGVRPVGKEYNISAQLGRIDTLGLDENNAPTIIEYKLDTSPDVLDQGLFYYKWLKENKGHFELLVAQTLGAGVKVKWEQPRLILIAQRFGVYTVAAAGTLPNVDLIRYSLLENGLLVLDKVAGPHVWHPTPPTSPLSEPVEEVVEDVQYSVEYHLGQTKAELRDPFMLLRDYILGLGEIEERAQQKTGITYRTTKSLVRFEFNKGYIDTLLRREAKQGDVENRVEDISRYEWGYPLRFRFTKPEDVEYIKQLLWVSYTAIQ